MKYLILLLLLNNLLSGQNYLDSIYDINYNREDKYAFIDSLIKDKKIIALGEISHGDGTTFIHKTELIKYLHKKHGFNIVLIESPFGQMELINQYQYEDVYKKSDSLKEQIFGIWSKANEAQALFEYIENEKLTLTGFDCQQTNNFNQIQDSINKRYFGESNIVHEENKFISTLAVLLDNYGTSRKLISKKNRTNFIFTIDTLINHNKLINNKSDLDLFWDQLLVSIKGYALLCWEKDEIKSVFIRDEYMAYNTTWLINKKFKNDKIIIWAATEHLCRNQYLLNKNDSKYKLMGDFLFKNYKKDLYVMSFIWFKGITNDFGFNNTEYTSRDTMSLEFKLSKKYNFAFVDLSKYKSFKVTAIENFGIIGSKYYPKWDEILDGLYFINEMKPSTRVKLNYK